MNITMNMSVALELDRPGLKRVLLYLLAVWHWACHLAFLSLNVLIFKLEGMFFQGIFIRGVNEISKSSVHFPVDHKDPVNGDYFTINSSRSEF